MTLQGLLNQINQAKDIQTFAVENLLKLADSGDSRYILNYSEQILDTPKNWVSHYCRGLTLAGEPNNYTIIAKAFDRFYNIGENPDYIKDDYNIDFEKLFYVDFKYDGSLILLYFWNGVWRVNTRGSFAQGKVSDICDKTWEELFWEGFKANTDNNLHNLDKTATYIFELCSPYNQVIEYYPNTLTACLSVTYRCGKELYGANANNICKTIEEVNQKLSNLSATQEGFVLKQWDKEKQAYIRRKVKTKSWVELSHLKESTLNTESKLWNVVFSNDYGDVVSVFPHLKEPIERKDKQYKDLLSEVETTYNQHKNIEDKKEFAMTIKDLPFKAILFSLRSGRDLKLCTQEYLTKNF